MAQVLASPRDFRPSNSLLAALPAEEFGRIASELITSPMTLKQVLLRSGDRLEHVFFPNGGVCSVTVATEDGHLVEVATVGADGLVGLDAVLGAQHALTETIVQMANAGDTLTRLPIAAFARELARHGTLSDLAFRYSRVLMSEMVQATACNALHRVEERCCRWLLRMHDRAVGDQFYLSHEFLAAMLGVRRSSVTVVAGALQKAGLIRYAKAQVTIVDRPRVEAASCECYALLREHFERAQLPKLQRTPR
jgi:CRP-like cAMP-binding protein